ncbi:MAG TPA: F-box-like domain-containing protein [Candidatus Saccharimonadales bacterium]|nr:F-box-like domain-containing protein [Candidatus Saccharimonadales bacterium]
MNKLPKELIEIIFDTLDMDDVIRLCTSSKENRVLCNNEKLWRHLYYKHYKHCQMTKDHLNYYQLVRRCYELDRIQILRQREERFNSPHICDYCDYYYGYCSCNRIIVDESSYNQPDQVLYTTMPPRSRVDEL